MNDYLARLSALMTKEYLVGIDFGHGETAAWIVPINGNTEIAPYGNSLRLTSDNSEGNRQIWSVVFKEKGGNYSLELKGGASSPITELKDKPRTLSVQKQQAYKNFISLVVDRLLKINNLLKYDEVENEYNFALCIACPTSWKQDEIDEYLQFFNDALSPKGIRVLWIIRESDAAFFSKLNMADNTGCTLVIDYGSSTIDYTAMENMIKISKDEWSSKTLGASNIEKLMMRPVDRVGFDDFLDKYEKAQNIIRETGNMHIDIDEILRLECRKAKERLYKDSQRISNVHFNLATYIPGCPRCVFDYDFDLVSDNGFGEYCEKVKNSFAEFKNKLNRRVDKIILSGGACIMPWVAGVVREVFDRVNIVDDQFPQYVVANGVALYAKAQMEALVKLKEKLESEDFAKIYQDADRAAMLSAVDSMSSNSLATLRSQEAVSADSIRSTFCGAMQRMDANDPDYWTLFQNKFNTLISNAAATCIKDAFKEVFSVEKDTKDVRICVNPQRMVWGNVAAFTVGGKFYNMIGDWIVKNSNAIFGATFFQWEDDRRGTEKTKIIEGTLSCMKEYLEKSNLINANDLKSAAQTVKDNVLDSAIEIFYSKQIFKTTFSD